MTSIPSPPRTALWSAGLVGLVLGGCFLFGCLEPLVAVAVVAAGALPLGRALLLTAAVWLAAQAVGFGLHDYPRDAQTISWGVGLGAAALGSTLIARGGETNWLEGLQMVTIYMVSAIAFWLLG